MWTDTASMTIDQTLIVSGMGLLIVFSLLCVLAISLKIFAKIFEMSDSKKAEAAPAGAAAVDLGVYARIIAAVCEEMNADPEDIVIKSITTVEK